MTAVLAGACALALTVLAVVVLAVVVLRRRVVVVSVNGPSMAPTLRHGDRVLVRRTTGVTPARGDIVVVSEPGPCRPGAPAGASDPSLVVKRVVAVAGDAEPDFLPGWARRPEGVVRAGELIVLGDNPESSWDSRQFGAVRAEQVLGVVLRPLKNPMERKRP